MKKFSSIDRFIGKVSPDAIHDFEESFVDQSFLTELVGKEKEKTTDQLEIIALANKITNEIRRDFGLDDFDIPVNNIHILAKTDFPDIQERPNFSMDKQAIFLPENLSNLVFAEILIHEMLHFKSYQALQTTVGEEPILATYRTGLVTNNRYGSNEIFFSIDEAVTEELTKRALLANSDSPLFVKEIKQTIELAGRYPNSPILNNDVYYIETILDSSEAKTEIGITANEFSYHHNRRILNTLIDKIFERNRDKFDNREQVFRGFVKGMMTGDVLAGGKLIERTFGSGTLRKIGDLDQELDKLEDFVNSL